MSANKSWLLYALGLAAVAVLCFGHLASHPFDLDDEFYLADSTRSLDNWAYFFSADKHFAGRPVSEFALLVGYFIAGSDPAFLHGLAVAGHLLASLLLALACASLGAGRELSWTAGMLFLVGVAHFHAVFWISAIAYPIAFALSALALIGYTRLAATGDHRWLALHYAAALAGALAHIAAIAVWPFCLLLAWQRDRHLIPHLLPLGALLVAAAVWATLAYPHTAQVDQASRIPAPLDVGWVALWLWSRLLSTAHWLPLTIYAFADWELGLGILTVVLCALPAWRGEIRPLAWLLCATLPFLTTSPDFLRGIFSGLPLLCQRQHRRADGPMVAMARGTLWTPAGNGDSVGAVRFKCLRPSSGRIHHFLFRRMQLLDSGADRSQSPMARAHRRGPSPYRPT